MKKLNSLLKGWENNWLSLPAVLLIFAGVIALGYYSIAGAAIAFQKMLIRVEPVDAFVSLNRAAYLAGSVYGFVLPCLLLFLLGREALGDEHNRLKRLQYVFGGVVIFCSLGWAASGQVGGAFFVLLILLPVVYYLLSHGAKRAKEYNDLIENNESHKVRVSAKHLKKLRYDMRYWENAAKAEAEDLIKQLYKLENSDYRKQLQEEQDRWNRSRIMISLPEE